MTKDPIPEDFPVGYWQAIQQLHTRIDRSLYPKLKNLSWHQIYQGAMGPGGLYLASDMAEGMELRPGQRVLDIGCGRGATSIFLACEYGVQVIAADLWISPSEIMGNLRAAGVEDRVFPLQVDIRHHPFAEESFDALFCMDSYFYYGTDDFFLRGLAKVLKPNAHVCIGSPCFSHEMNPEPGTIFAFDDAWGYHYPGYWERMFERSHMFVDIMAQEHRLGAELWSDYLLFNIEHRNTPEERKAWFEDIAILQSNKQRQLTHFILRAKRYIGS